MRELPEEVLIVAETSSVLTKDYSEQGISLTRQPTTARSFDDRCALGNRLRQGIPVREERHGH
jgi:hypothetical protein